MGPHTFNVSMKLFSENRQRLVTRLRLLLSKIVFFFQICLVVTFIQLLLLLLLFFRYAVCIFCKEFVFTGPNSKVSMAWYFCGALENSRGVARETPQTVILFSDKRVTSTGTFNLSSHQSQFHCNLF